MIVDSVDFRSYPRRSFAARRLYDLDRTHSAFAAGRASAHIDTGKPKQGLLPRFGLLIGIVVIGAGQKFPAPVKFLLPASVPQQAVVPDLDESVGKDMQQEPPDELVCADCHDLAFIVVGVIPPPERDVGVFKLHDPVIADRDPMGVPAEIFKNAFGPVERRLAVDDPLLPVQVSDQGTERPALRKMAYGARQNSPSA